MNASGSSASRGLVDGQLPPVTVRPRMRRRPVGARTAGTAAVTASLGYSISAGIRELFSRVQWTPSLIAFLYYYFVVITYYLPGADIAMVAAVVLLIFQVDTLRIGRVLKIFGALVAWAWLCFLASATQSAAFDQTWALTKLWIVAFVAFNVVRTREQVRFFLAFAVGCFMFFPARGALVNWAGGYNISGRALWNFVYNNPNDLAGFALIFSSIALAMSIVTKSKLTRALCWLSAGALVLLIFFTQSRGTLLATGVVTLVIVGSRLRNPRVLLGAVAIIGVAAIAAPKGVWNRLGGLSNVSVQGQMQGVDEEGSAEQRFQLMRIAYRMAIDHPVLGVGAGAYPVVHMTYARAFSGEFPLAGGSRDAHNTFLRTAAELGFVGLALFLVESIGTSVVAFRRARRLRDDDRQTLRMLSFGLVAFLLSGIFASLAYINVLHLHLVLMESFMLLPMMPVAARTR